MSAENILKEAKHGITLMRKYDRHFDFYFVGTLACLKSSLDYLLEEYNESYQLGIDLESDHLSAQTFRRNAERQQKQYALDFINYYDKLYSKFDEKVMKIIKQHGVRDLTIHRKRLPRAVLFDVNTDKAEHYLSKDVDLKTLATDSLRSDKELVSICEHTSGKLEDFFHEIRSKFPLESNN